MYYIQCQLQPFIILFCLMTHIYIIIRVANVVADHDDILTQWRPIKMSKFRANFFFDTNYFQLLLGLGSFQKSED